jgi:hypothetical protein
VWTQEVFHSVLKLNSSLDNLIQIIILLMRLKEEQWCLSSQCFMEYVVGPMVAALDLKMCLQMCPRLMIKVTSPYILRRLRMGLSWDLVVQE